MAALVATFAACKNLLFDFDVVYFYEVAIPAGTCQTLKGFAHKIISYLNKYGFN